MTDTTTALAAFIRELKSRSPSQRPKGAEKWETLIQRISRPTEVHEIDQQTFDYFLEVLPPRWMGNGGFAFGEGADLLRFFWNVTNGRFYCRQLTWEEHLKFVRLAGIGMSTG